MEDNLTNIPFSLWKKALGCTINVETTNKKVFTGRLYVVDPQTVSIVLVQEDKSAVIIPGHAVQKVNADVISFEEHDISDFLDPLQRQTVTYSQEELDMRKEKLKHFLTQNGLNIEENEGTLICQDHVFIEAPYKEDNFFCSNVILLERIRDVLAKIPVD